MLDEKIDTIIGPKFLKKRSNLSEKDRENSYSVEECGVDEWHGAQFLLIFFSAGWCPPCEQFLQVLKDFYSEVNIGKKDVEVLYVSSDKSESEFKETYSKMPWLTYPYSSANHRALKQKFDIVGVPMVLVLEAGSGFLISRKGRKDICDLGVGCMKNWAEEMPDMLATV